MAMFRAQMAAAGNEIRESRMGLRDLLHRLFRGRRRQLLFLMVFFGIKHAPSVVWPYVVKLLIDAAAYPADERWWWIGGVSAAFVLLISQNITFHLLYIRDVSRLARGLARDLRHQLTARLMMLSLTYHRRTSPGRLQSKLLKEVEYIRQLPQFFFDVIFSAVMVIVFALSLIAILAPLMLIPVLLMVPLGIWVARKFDRKLERQARAHRLRYESMSTRLSDMITMLPVTKVHALEDEQRARISDVLDNEYDAGHRFDMTTAWLGSTSWSTFRVFEVGFLLVAIASAINGYITIGSVVAFMIYFQRIGMNLERIIATYPRIAEGKAAFEALDEVFADTDLDPWHGDEPLPRIAGAFACSALSYAYAPWQDPVLADINLDIPAGSSLALVGPSGSGKTTLLNILLGFLEPDRGSITLDGRPFASFSMRDYRRQLAVVLQEPCLFTGSVYENVTYGAGNPGLQQVRRALEQAQALEFVEALPDGWDTVIGDAGVGLSGGQKQRLTIARAFLRDPRVLIMDEPTSSLDLESQFQVKQAMLNLMDGRTTIIASHSLTVVRDVDRIAIVEAGRITACASHAELAGRDNFYSQALARA